MTEIIQKLSEQLARDNSNLKLQQFQQFITSLTSKGQKQKITISFSLIKILAEVLKHI